MTERLRSEFEVVASAVDDVNKSLETVLHSAERGGDAKLDADLTQFRSTLEALRSSWRAALDNLDVTR